MASAVRTRIGTVVSRSTLTPHLVRITLDVGDMSTTGIPDEYVRLMIPADPSTARGADVVLPEIDEQWNVTWPEGVEPPAYRVYTISDHRWIDGVAEVDIDIALHDAGVGSDWAKVCEPGDRIGFVEPHGLYVPVEGVPWQLLVCDITGLPALARILRGLDAGQRAEAVVVLTDERDRIALPSAADVDVRWVVVDTETDTSDALSEAVTARELPAEGPRYVWLAGEARASRAVRRRLRRELGWPQSDFYTCGYWQIDKEKWESRFQQVEDVVLAESRRAQAELADDHGAFLDALDDIYEKVGL
ncbi:siderophore-interacting protein [Aeromicrobium sp. CTD01-1L150]|uniref:siderophore-interacting protein n=1 Tax=Aeromicrobium sp. CTD01-1L150 TaxID=3341830 RepID=UPI0035C09455